MTLYYSCILNPFIPGSCPRQALQQKREANIRAMQRSASAPALPDPSIQQTLDYDPDAALVEIATSQPVDVPSPSDPGSASKTENSWWKVERDQEERFRRLEKLPSVGETVQDSESDDMIAQHLQAALPAPLDQPTAPAPPQDDGQPKKSNSGKPIDDKPDPSDVDMKEETTVPTSVQPEHSKITEPKDVGITEPKDGTITGPKDGTITGPKDGTITEPKDGTITEPKRVEIIEPEDGMITEPKDVEVVEPKGDNNAEMKSAKTKLIKSPKSEIPDEECMMMFPKDTLMKAPPASSQTLAVTQDAVVALLEGMLKDGMDLSQAIAQLKNGKSEKVVPEDEEAPLVTRIDQFKRKAAAAAEASEAEQDQEPLPDAAKPEPKEAGKRKAKGKAKGKAKAKAAPKAKAKAAGKARAAKAKSKPGRRPRVNKKGKGEEEVEDLEETDRRHTARG